MKKQQEQKPRRGSSIAVRPNQLGALPDYNARIERRSCLTLGTGRTFPLATIASLNVRGNYDAHVQKKVIEAFISTNEEVSK